MENLKTKLLACLDTEDLRGLVLRQDREITELRAQLAHNYPIAITSLRDISQDRLMGSGAVLQISGLGGKTLLGPICISDGLSKEALGALKVELTRVYEQISRKTS